MHFCCDISIVSFINLVLWFYLVASVPATQTAIWRIYFGKCYFHAPLTNNVNEVKTKSIINTVYNTNRLHTHNKETGPPRPSLPSRLAQWTARSLSSLPVMQRSRLLLRRAAMLSEWKPGVSERNWGRNPRPSTLSAGEYHLLSGRGSTGHWLVTYRCGYCRYRGRERGYRGVFRQAEAAASLSAACLLPPVVSVFRSRQLSGLC